MVGLEDVAYLPQTANCDNEIEKQNYLTESNNEKLDFKIISASFVYLSKSPPWTSCSS